MKTFFTKESISIFFISLIFHALALMKWGIHVTNDYKGIYKPAALHMLSVIMGGGDWIGEFGNLLTIYDTATHLVWIIVVMFFNYCFAESACYAIVVFNILLTSVLYSVLVAFCQRNFGNKIIAFITGLMLLLFYPNFYWVLFVDPTCFYRALFFFLFFLLLSPYLEKKPYVFFTTVVVSFLLLAMVRIDTVVLFLPIFVFAFFRLYQLWRIKFIYLQALLLSIGCFVFFKSNLAESIIQVIYSFTKYGYIVMGDGSYQNSTIAIEAFDTAKAQNFLYILTRFSKLLVYRTFYYLSPLRPFWPTHYMVYHGLFLGVVYILSIASMRRIWVTKNTFFSMMISFFFASILLHGLSRIDMFLRTAVTPYTFLIVFSGYGADYIWARLKGITIN